MGNQTSRDRPPYSDPMRSVRGLGPMHDMRAMVPQLPVLSKLSLKGADARLAYGVGSMQGWRDSV